MKQINETENRKTNEWDFETEKTFKLSPKNSKD